MLITLDGCSGSGKSTLSTWLTEQHGYVSISYGTEVKHGFRMYGNFVVSALKGFASYRQLLDLEPDENYVFEHFWLPPFFSLFRVARTDKLEIFHETIQLYSDIILELDVCKHMKSFWLDVPWAVCDNRVRMRQNGELLTITESDLKHKSSWDCFACEMADQLPYFHLLDATQSPQRVQNQLTTILDLLT